ncbi:unnamed protein product [Prunus armeniaca]
MTGGSGKVLKSGPNDHVFIYYADDGSAGLLGMPSEDDSVSAKDLIHVLKKKHLCKGFKSMKFPLTNPSRYTPPFYTRLRPLYTAPAT